MAPHLIVSSIVGFNLLGAVLFVRVPVPMNAESHRRQAGRRCQYHDQT